jgi:hypothetical protein
MIMIAAGCLPRVHRLIVGTFSAGQGGLRLLTLGVFSASVGTYLRGFYFVLKCGDFLFYRKACPLETYRQEQKMKDGRIKQYWIITDTS